MAADLFLPRWDAQRISQRRSPGTPLTKRDQFLGGKPTIWRRYHITVLGTTHMFYRQSWLSTRGMFVSIVYCLHIHYCLPCNFNWTFLILPNWWRVDRPMSPAVEASLVAVVPHQILGSNKRPKANGNRGTRQPNLLTECGIQEGTYPTDKQVPIWIWTCFAGSISNFCIITPSYYHYFDYQEGSVYHSSRAFEKASLRLHDATTMFPRDD